MNNPKINIIAAISENRGLGKDNKLLFNIPEDMARFKKLTMGHPIIMGRKTFESIGRVLPGRTNIIITSDEYFDVEGAVVTNSIDEAISIAKDRETFREDQNEREIFITGGGNIFAQTIDFADRLYLTVVEGVPAGRQENYDADTFFPDYSEFRKVICQEQHESNGYKYKFVELERDV